MFNVPAPAPHVQFATVRPSLNAVVLDWCRNHATPHGIIDLLSECRREAKHDEAEARRLFARRMPHAVEHGLTTIPTDMLTEIAYGVLVNAADWTRIAEDFADEYTPMACLLATAIEREAGDTEVEARAAEVAEELASAEALHNFNWLTGGGEFDAPYDPSTPVLSDAFR